MSSRRPSTGSAPPLRVLLADTHQLLLDGMRQALERSGSFAVAAEATSLPGVMPLVRRERPEVVILDLEMGGGDARDALDALRVRHPKITVVVLSTTATAAQVEDALAHGASAFIVKSIAPADLPSALLGAVEAPIAVPLGLPAGLPSDAARRAGLTPRELAVLTLATEGLPISAVAKRLWIAPQTAKFHLSNVYRKLGAANRQEAIRLAYRRGILESPRYRGEAEWR